MWLKLEQLFVREKEKYKNQQFVAENYYLKSPQICLQIFLSSIFECNYAED